MILSILAVSAIALAAVLNYLILSAINRVFNLSKIPIVATIASSTGYTVSITTTAIINYVSPGNVVGLACWMGGWVIAGLIYSRHHSVNPFRFACLWILFIVTSSIVIGSLSLLFYYMTTVTSYPPA